MRQVGQSEIETLMAQVVQAQRAGRSAEARRGLDAILARAPEHPFALNALGVAALGEGRANEAAELFARAAKADPSAPGLWVNLAKARRLANDDAGERDALQRALEADQRHLMANVRLAELHERLGETAEAHFRWAAVLQLTAGAPPGAEVDALAKRAAAFVETGNAELAEALDARLGDRLRQADPVTARRFAACRDVALGRRRVYRNECNGLYYPFLPADEFFDRSHFPWLPALEAKWEAIRDEFLALSARGDAGFAPYVRQAKGTPTNKWSRLDGSLNWNALYLYKYGDPQAEALAACPVTAGALEDVPLARIPGRGPTAFFSVLRPRAHIPAHTGVTNVRAIVHLPLVVPEGCRFRVGGETRAWREGEAFAFDDTIEHEAWNDSDAPRAVLILDVWNPYLTDAEQGLIGEFFATAGAPVGGEFD